MVPYTFLGSLKHKRYSLELYYLSVTIRNFIHTFYFTWFLRIWNLTTHTKTLFWSKIFSELGDKAPQSFWSHGFSPHFGVMGAVTKMGAFGQSISPKNLSLMTKGVLPYERGWLLAISVWVDQLSKTTFHVMTVINTFDSFPTALTAVLVCSSSNSIYVTRRTEHRPRCSCPRPASGLQCVAAIKKKFIKKITKNPVWVFY